MQRRTQTICIAVLIVGSMLAAVIVYSNLQGIRPANNPNVSPPPGNNPQCKGTAACFTDAVTYIVDGDTLDVGSTRIRLALVNSPEVGEPGYTEAKQFTAQTCPAGSQALVDEDDGQTGGSYGRRIAAASFGAVNPNAACSASGNAVLVTDY